jgi:hypothetical protein
MSDGDDSDGAGWLYCFENPCMPGIYKIGLTTRTPEERLANANASDTWKPPMPYQIVMTRRVNRVREIERTVHSLLEELGMRVHPRREFFRVSRSIVEKIFTLVDPIPNTSGDVIEHVEDELVDSTSPPQSKCEWCSWNGRSSRYPYHLISRHLTRLEHFNSVDDHCVFIRTKESDAYVCLTCKRGTMHTSVGRVGRRWLQMHSKQTGCCEKHTDTFEKTLTYWGLVRHKVAEEEDSP